MPRKPTIVQKPPTLPSERAIKALAQQLDGLQILKDRRYDEAAPDESQWVHLTKGIVEAACGDPSSGLTDFYRARNAGIYSMGGTSPQQRQLNFELRVREFNAVLRSLIDVFRLQLPEEEIKGVYESGDQYGFYRDLSSLIATTAQEIFIVDAYPDTNIFKLYIDEVPTNALIRILSHNISDKFKTVAKLCAQNKHIGLRFSDRIHDRVVFVDERGWIIGQSIKDAARKAPMNMIELGESVLATTRNIYEEIWTAAAIIVP